jgi:hypothetical protein
MRVEFNRSGNGWIVIFGTGAATGRTFVDVDAVDVSLFVETSACGW